MVGSPLFHSLCPSNKRQNFLPPVAIAQWSWQSPHSTVFIIIIAQPPVYGNCVLQKMTVLLNTQNGQETVTLNDLTQCSSNVHMVHHQWAR